jgi:Na+/melibiose symporter-like transporter
MRGIRIRPGHFLYAAGQVGMMGLTRYLFGWLLDFSRSAGPDGAALFSGTAVGAVFLGFRIFDGVTDPVAGLLSDGWVRRGHERRRLLWLSFALPPVGLALCFLPHHGMAPELRWALLVAGLFVFFVGYTFYAIPYWSLVDDYSGGDRDERRVLSTALGAGLLIATAIGFVASPALVESRGFLGGAVAFALPAVALMVLPWFAAPSGVPAHGAAPPDAPRPSLLRALGVALAHRRFLAFLVLFTGSQMSFTIMTAAAPFIAVDLLGGTRGQVALLLGPLLAVAVPCFAGVPAISRRLGWERGLLVASLLLAGVYCLCGGLGRGIVGSPLVTAAIIFGLGGPMTAVLLGLEAEAIADCARERGDAVATYFGVFNLVVKAFNGVAMLAAGVLADLSLGDLGPVAVRLMGLSAGACLFVCAGIHLLIRPRRKVDLAREGSHHGDNE